MKLIKTATSILIAITVANTQATSLNCARGSIETQIEALKQNVNIAPIDRRYALQVSGPRLRLSVATMKRIRKTSGYVVCPGDPQKNNQSVGSGGMVGDDGSIIATSVHTFVDEAGNLREPLSECFFQNQDTPYLRVKLSFKEGDFKFLTQNWKNDPDMDIAIVSLAETIPGAKPFPISNRISHTQKGPKNVLMISAKQEKLSRAIDPKDPILQDCAGHDFEFPPGTPPQIYTDCSIAAGGSGSFVYDPTEPNNLRIIGLVDSGGVDHLDGVPYDRARGSYARTLVFNETVVSAIKEIQQRRPTVPQTEQRNYANRAPPKNL